MQHTSDEDIVFMENSIKEITSHRYDVVPEIWMKDIYLRMFVKSSYYSEIENAVSNITSVKFEKFSARDTK